MKHCGEYFEGRWMDGLFGMYTQTVETKSIVNPKIYEDHVSPKLFYEDHVSPTVYRNVGKLFYLRKGRVLFLVLVEPPLALLVVRVYLVWYCPCGRGDVVVPCSCSGFEDSTNDTLLLFVFRRGCLIGKGATSGRDAPGTCLIPFRMATASLSVKMPVGRTCSMTSSVVMARNRTKGRNSFTSSLSRYTGGLSGDVMASKPSNDSLIRLLPLRKKNNHNWMYIYA